MWKARNVYRYTLNRQDKIQDEKFLKIMKECEEYIETASYNGDLFVTFPLRCDLSDHIKKKVIKTLGLYGYDVTFLRENYIRISWEKGGLL